MQPVYQFQNWQQQLQQTQQYRRSEESITESIWIWCASCQENGLQADPCRASVALYFSEYRRIPSFKFGLGES